MLKPRQSPNKPPILEINPILVIFFYISYSEKDPLTMERKGKVFKLPISVDFPKNMLTTAISFSYALYALFSYKVC